jgi:hypothetical protein
MVSPGSRVVVAPNAGEMGKGAVDLDPVVDAVRLASDADGETAVPLAGRRGGHSQRRYGGAGEENEGYH